MEREASPSGGLSHVERAHVEFVRLAKVAVATAVIRSKPVTMTGEQYAAFLQQKVKAEGEKWKDRCEELEHELLQMKTRLMMKDPSESAANENGITQAEDIPSCLSATPPSSSERMPEYQLVKCSHKIVDDAAIRSHTDFLDSVSRVRFAASYLDKVAACQSGKWAGGEDMSDEWLKAKIVNEQTIASVEVILAVLRGLASGKKLTITLDTLHRSVSCVTRLLESLEDYFLSLKYEESQRLLGIMADIVDRCSLVSLQLQGSIVTLLPMGKHKLQLLKCEMIVTLATSPSLCRIIIQQLIQGIAAVGRHLKASCDEDYEQSPGLPPIYILHENVCYLFKTLEAILQYQLNAASSIHNQGPSGLDDPPLSETAESSRIAPTETPNKQTKETRVPSEQSSKKCSKKRTDKVGKSQKSKSSSGNIVDFFKSMKNSSNTESQDLLHSHDFSKNNTDGQVIQTTQHTPDTHDSQIRRTSPLEPPIPTNPDFDRGGWQEASCTLTPGGQNDPSWSANYGHCPGPGEGVAGRSVVTAEFLETVQMAMEDTLVETCDSFPLFSYYVWKISDLVLNLAEKTS